MGSERTPYVFLVTCAMNCSFVTVVWGVKYPVKLPTKFPKTTNIKGMAAPDPMAVSVQRPIMK
jgi:hypothetical protein